MAHIVAQCATNGTIDYSALRSTWNLLRDWHPLWFFVPSWYARQFQAHIATTKHQAKSVWSSCLFARAQTIQDDNSDSEKRDQKTKCNSEVEKPDCLDGMPAKSPCE